jgi:hypothetical protein
MDSLTITFRIGPDREESHVRSAHIHVAAKLNRSLALAGTLTGQLLYLLPNQVRQIQASNYVTANFKGWGYHFVRLDENGTFELRKSA